MKSITKKEALTAFILVVMVAEVIVSFAAVLYAHRRNSSHASAMLWQLSPSWPPDQVKELNRSAMPWWDVLSNPHGARVLFTQQMSAIPLMAGVIVLNSVIFMFPYLWSGSRLENVIKKQMSPYHPLPKEQEAADQQKSKGSSTETSSSPLEELCFEMDIPITLTQEELLQLHEMVLKTIQEKSHLLLEDKETVIKQILHKTEHFICNRSLSECSSLLKPSETQED